MEKAPQNRAHFTAQIGDSRRWLFAGVTFLSVGISMLAANGQAKADVTATEGTDAGNTATAQTNTDHQTETVNQYTTQSAVTASATPATPASTDTTASQNSLAPTETVATVQSDQPAAEAAVSVTDPAKDVSTPGAAETTTATSTGTTDTSESAAEQTATAAQTKTRVASEAVVPTTPEETAKLTAENGAYTQTRKAYDAAEQSANTANSTAADLYTALENFQTQVSAVNNTAAPSLGTVQSLNKVIGVLQGKTNGLLAQASQAVDDTETYLNLFDNYNDELSKLTDFLPAQYAVAKPSTSSTDEGRLANYIRELQSVQTYLDDTQSALTAIHQQSLNKAFVDSFNEKATALNQNATALNETLAQLTAAANSGDQLETARLTWAVNQSLQAYVGATADYDQAASIYNRRVAQQDPTELNKADVVALHAQQDAQRKLTHDLLQNAARIAVQNNAANHATAAYKVAEAMYQSLEHYWTFLANLTPTEAQNVDPDLINPDLVYPSIQKVYGALSRANMALDHAVDWYQHTTGPYWRLSGTYAQNQTNPWNVWNWPGFHMPEGVWNPSGIWGLQSTQNSWRPQKPNLNPAKAQTIVYPVVSVKTYQQTSTSTTLPLLADYVKAPAKLTLNAPIRVVSDGSVATTTTDTSTDPGRWTPTHHHDWTGAGSASDGTYRQVDSETTEDTPAALAAASEGTEATAVADPVVDTDDDDDDDETPAQTTDVSTPTAGSDQTAATSEAAADPLTASTTDAPAVTPLATTASQTETTPSTAQTSGDLSNTAASLPQTGDKQESGVSAVGAGLLLLGGVWGGGLEVRRRRTRG